MRDGNIAISLAKALKLKNRLAGRLNQVQTNIRLHNSTLAEQRNKYDIPAMIAERTKLIEALIGLKTNIAISNNEIQEAIIRRGELKSSIEFLSTLNTSDGISRHGYQNTEVTHVAIIKSQDVLQQSRAMEKEMDAIQDKVDEYNINTKIVIPQEWLDLGS